MHSSNLKLLRELLVSRQRRRWTILIQRCDETLKAFNEAFNLLNTVTFLYLLTSL